VTGTGSIGGGAIIGMGYVYHDLTALTTAYGTFLTIARVENPKRMVRVGPFLTQMQPFRRTASSTTRPDAGRE
jgi:hypothetical protein